MSWDIKDIVSLVQLNVLSIESAREMLGLDGKKEDEQVEAEEQASAVSPYAEVPLPMNTHSEDENN